MKRIVALLLLFLSHCLSANPQLKASLFALTRTREAKPLIKHVSRFEATNLVLDVLTKEPSADIYSLFRLQQLLANSEFTHIHQEFTFVYERALLYFPHLSLDSAKSSLQWASAQETVSEDSYKSRATKILKAWYAHLEQFPEHLPLDTLLFPSPTFTPWETSFAELVTNSPVNQELKKELIEKESTSDSELSADVIESPVIRLATREKPLDSSEAENAIEIGNHLLAESKSAGGNTDTVTLIKAVGQTAINVSKAIQKYKKATSNTSKDTPSLYNAVALVTDLSAAVSNFLSLVSQSGSPGFEETVLRQLNTITTQIENMHTEMRERFDRLDASVDKVFESLTLQLRNVEAQAESHSLTLKQVEFSIEAIEANLSHLQGSVHALIRSGMERSLTVRAESCIHQNFFDLPRSRSDYLSCLKDLETFSTLLSKDAVSSGRKPMPSDSTLALDPSPWHHINTWVHYASRFQRTLPSSPLVNPFHWAKFAGAYLKLANHWPDIYFQFRAIEMTQNILKAGRELEQTLASLSFQTTRGRALSSPTFFKSLIKDYQESLEALENTLWEEKTAFQQTHERLDGYSISNKTIPKAKKGARLPSFSQSEIGICEGTIAHSPHPHEKQPRLASPTVLLDPISIDPTQREALFSNAALVAHHLRLGTIHICYDTVRWVDTEYNVPAITPHMQYGKLSVVIRGTFDLEGERLPLFSTQLSSKHTYTTGFHPPGYGRTDNPISPNLLYLEEDPTRRAELSQIPLSVLELGLVVEWEKLFKDRFLDLGKEILSPSEKEKTVTQIEKLLSRYLNVQLVGELNQRVALEDFAKSADMNRARQRLTLSRNALTAFTSLSTPYLLERSDGVRRFILDPSALPDGNTAWDGKRSSPFFGEKKETFTQKAQSQATQFEENLVSALRLTTPDENTLPILRERILNLELMKQLQEASRPDSPMTEAIRDLKKEIDQFLHGETT